MFIDFLKQNNADANDDPFRKCTGIIDSYLTAAAAARPVFVITCANQPSTDRIGAFPPDPSVLLV